MEETYCGKFCETCNDRAELNCPGCRKGPGAFGKDRCEVARCCESKGHTTCITCLFHDSCGLVRRRNGMARERMEQKVREEERKVRLCRKSSFLGRWLWILFWLVIPGTVAGLMTNDTVVEWFPGWRMPGEILNMLTTGAYGVILLKISSEEERYRVSGICCLAAAVLYLGGAVTGALAGEGLSLLFLLPAAIVGLVSEYQEYMGHGDVLDGVDYNLADRWRKLWKWYVGCFGGLVVSVLVILISPLLGLLVLLAALIGLLVVSVLKLIYLYQTAKLFRNYPDSV